MDTSEHKSPELLTETVISLSQAARRLPPFRAGRPVSPATIWRWVNEGILLQNGNRLRLEAVRLGSRWVTSFEALVRFSKRQTPSQVNPSAPIAASRKGANRAADEVERALQKIGI